MWSVRGMAVETHTGNLAPRNSVDESCPTYRLFESDPWHCGTEGAASSVSASHAAAVASRAPRDAVLGGPH